MQPIDYITNVVIIIIVRWNPSTKSLTWLALRDTTHRLGFMHCCIALIMTIDCIDHSIIIIIIIIM